MIVPIGRVLTLAVFASMLVLPLSAQELQLRERAAAPPQAAKHKNNLLSTGNSNLLSTGCTYRPPAGTRYVELDSRGCPIAPADANAAAAPPYPTAVYPQINTPPQAVTTPAPPQTTTGIYPYPPPIVTPPQGLPPDWTPLPQPNTTTTITKNPDGSSSTTTTPVAPPNWAPVPPAGWQTTPAPVSGWYGPKGTEPKSTATTSGTDSSGGVPSADGSGTVIPPSYPVITPPQGLPPGWTPLPQPNTTTTIIKGPDGSSSTTTTPVAPPNWAPPPPAGWQSMPATPANRWYGAKGATP